MKDNLETRSKISEFLTTIIEASHLDLRFDLESRGSTNATLTVRFHGADVSMLMDQQAVLLNAISHLIVETHGFSEATLESVSITLMQPITKTQNSEASQRSPTSSNSDHQPQQSEGSI